MINPAQSAAEPTHVDSGRESSHKKDVVLNPVFHELGNPRSIINHIEQLVKENEPTAHADILQQLLEQFEPLDYEALANSPQTENFKITNKHYLVLSIENVLYVAEKNRWGLCKNHDFIFIYNGTYWAQIDTDTFQKFLGEAAERMGVAIFSARYYQFREQLFKQFLATAYLPTPVGDKHAVKSNLKNGTYVIGPQCNQLQPFNPKDFMTYQLPFEYDPQAKAPIFEAYLNRVLPDQQRQMVMAEYLGYVFIKHGSSALKEEKALILYGTGANGKSVFFEIVNAMLGAENVSSYSLQSLTNENGYFRAKLANKLVNYASEINGRLESSIFKQLVSGEPVEARLPYGEPFTLRQYAKLIFNVNELPKDVEHTDAYFRRFLIIPFDVTIPEAEQDKQLHTKIIENELAGVFNWVLEGLHRILQQKRFSECRAAEEAVHQYRVESNSIQLFLDEKGYKKSHTDYKLIKDLYPDYKSFCFDDGMTPFKKGNFSKQLQALGIQIDRENGTGQKIAYVSLASSNPF